jgi:hypothetical protein
MQSELAIIPSRPQLSLHCESQGGQSRYAHDFAARIGADEGDLSSAVGRRH